MPPHFDKGAPLQSSSWTRLGDGPSIYVATPHAPSKGTVLVAHEIFGISAHIREMCDHLAREGFTAVAPDFYWRLGERLEFRYDDEGRGRAMDAMRALTREGVLADLAAVRETIEGKPAIVGFSMGGHIALLAATEAPYTLAVDFYGGWTVHGGVPLALPQPPLSAAYAIAAYATPVMVLAGDRDKLIGDEDWALIGDRLTDYGVSHERVRYPGVEHGFMCADRDDWDADAAADAWSRVIGALGKRFG